MTSRDFCYWLQGYLEVTKARDGKLASLDQDQVRCVEQHLALVFKHEIDPSMGGPEHQAELNETHPQRPQIGGVGPGGAVYRC